MGMQNDRATPETSLARLRKLNRLLQYDTAIPLTGLCTFLFMQKPEQERLKQLCE